MMTGRERDPKIVPLQGVLHNPDGTKVLHPPCFEHCPPPPDRLDASVIGLGYTSGILRQGTWVGTYVS